jgi:hypothetical protein
VKPSCGGQKLKNKMMRWTKMNSKKLWLKVLTSFFHLYAGILIAKMLEWREREHEDDDAMALNDLGTINALRQCGLLKLFKIQGMRAQLRLLEYLVHMWDVDQQVFHVLSLDIKDIYFLTGLSRHIAQVTIIGGQGGGLPMSEYIRRYCVPKVERRKGKVAIRGVHDLTLRTIIFTIAWMAGSASPYMAL